MLVAMFLYDVCGKDSFWVTLQVTPLVTVALLIEAGMARLELCQTEFSDFGHSPLMSRDIKAIFYALLHKLKKMLSILQDSRESLWIEALQFCNLSGDVKPRFCNSANNHSLLGEDGRPWERGWQRQLANLMVWTCPAKGLCFRISWSHWNELEMEAETMEMNYREFE